MAKKRPTKPTAQPPSLKKAMSQGAYKAGQGVSHGFHHPAVISGAAAIGGVSAGVSYMKQKRRAKKNGKTK